MTSIQSAKLGMSPDAFLYACIQSDEARRKKNGTFNSHLRYEPFLFETYRAPKALSLETFANELHTILQHHWQVNPQFRRGDFIDTDTISYFSQVVPTVFADVEQLVRLFFGREIPLLMRAEEAAEISDEFPFLEASIGRFQKYNDTLNEDSVAYDAAEGVDNPAIESAGFSTELWYVISELTKEIFGDYTGAFLGFVNWKFAPKEEAEVIDWRITPPVGSAYIKWRKSVDPDFGRRPFDRKGGRDDKRGGRDDKRGGHEDKHSHHGVEKHAEHTSKPEARMGIETQKEEPAHQENLEPVEISLKPRPAQVPGEISLESPRAPREHTKPEHKNRDHGFRDRAPRHNSRDTAPRQSSEEQVEAGLAEAQTAIAALQSDKKIMEVPLAPANSFIRRAQHSLIVEMGFETESRGEGRDRCVHVIRPK